MLHVHDKLSWICSSDIVYKSLYLQFKEPDSFKSYNSTVNSLTHISINIPNSHPEHFMKYWVISNISLKHCFLSLPCRNPSSEWKCRVKVLNTEAGSLYDYSLAFLGTKWIGLSLRGNIIVSDLWALHLLNIKFLISYSYIKQLYHMSVSSYFSYFSICSCTVLFHSEGHICYRGVQAVTE